MESKISNSHNGKVLVALTRKTVVQYLAWELGTRGAARALKGETPLQGEGPARPYRHQPQRVQLNTHGGYQFNGWTVPWITSPLARRPTAKDWREFQRRVTCAASYIDGRLGVGMYTHDVRIVDELELTLL